MSNHEKGSQKMVIPKMYVSYWANPNRYEGKCCLCGKEIPVRNGWTWKDRDRGRVVMCHRCAVMNSRSLPEEVSCRTMNGHEGKGQGQVDVHSCSACGHRVGLVKSKKGKWYLCEIREGGSNTASEERWYTKAMPWMPHKCKVDYREDTDGSGLTYREQYEKEVNAYQGEQA